MSQQNPTYKYDAHEMLEADLETLERYGSALTTYYSKQYLFEQALVQNRYLALNSLFDYYDVPKELTLQERITFFQLIG